MSPAQLQLCVALAERAASIAHDAYIDATSRCHELFEEMMQVNKLRDDLRAESESLAKEGK